MAGELPNIFLEDNEDGVVRANASAYPANQPPGQGREQGESHTVTQLGPSAERLYESGTRLNQPKVKISNPINWLGSSYSGSDIKVVAHTYNIVESPETKQREKRIEEVYADACDQLGRNLPQFEQQRVAGRQSGEIAIYNDLKKIWFNLAHIGLFVPVGEEDPSIHGEVKKRLEALLLQYLSFGGSGSAVPTFQHVLELEHINAKSYAENLGAIVEAWRQLNYSASSTETIASLQTISIQSHREKYGVRALGRSYVKGYTRGPRTIAGSMVMTVFNEHALARLLKAVGNAAFIGESKLDTNVSSLIPDQLPPLDLTVVFANEYGSVSRMGIYGVEFVNDSMTMSIEDLFTEEVINFVARDVDVMTSVGRRKLSQLERGAWTTGEGRPLEGSELLKKTMLGGGAAYKEYLTRLGIRRSFRGR